MLLQLGVSGRSSVRALRAELPDNPALARAAGAN